MLHHLYQPMKLKRLLIACLCCYALHGNAQWYNPDKVNKRAGEIYGNAYEAARDEDYSKAIRLLNEALALDAKFVDVYLSRAGIYANLKNYTASVADFEKALQMDSLYAKTYLLPYSISLAGTGNFEKALQRVNEFLQTPGLNQQSIQAAQYRKKCFEFALQYQATLQSRGISHYQYAPQNLGAAINSTALEYFPSLTIDGSKMIFTRRVNSDEDFYESNFTNGSWTTAVPVGGKINTNFNEGAQTLSQDGELLIFTGCNYPEGEGSCDLYIAYKTKTGTWTEPINMGQTINTEFWESSPSLSPDKKQLYFASNRPGGLGGKDIWVSTRLANGQWGAAQNLGPLINSTADEGCPFIHADNQTLYFNSNGHQGYGMTDLYLSRRNSNAQWDTAQNLGYPINTIDDEGSLIVSADGKTAFFASDGLDTRGGLDLYRFELRPDIRAAKTWWVKGKVYDAKTHAGLPSAIELTDLGTRNIISHLQTDEEGNYLVTLPIGKEYAFNVKRKGYLFFSENFKMQTHATDTALLINIPLQPIQTGAHIVLKNIFFNSREWVLKEESRTELNALVALMQENPSLKILISGHTDNVGKPADNLLLSNNRAKAVTGYLMQQGIAAQRLSAKGLGETAPVATNDTEEGRALNRRTELKILAN